MQLFMFTKNIAILRAVDYIIRSRTPERQCRNLLYRREESKVLFSSKRS